MCDESHTWQRPDILQCVTNLSHDKGQILEFESRTWQGQVMCDESHTWQRPDICNVWRISDITKVRYL